MASAKPTIMDLAIRVREQGAGRRLSPAQAKLYSQHTRLEFRRPSLPNFTSSDVEARLEEAWLLLDAAAVEREVAPEGEWRQGVKRAGELLEWLSHDGMDVMGVPTTTLAAGAYQLAGYPAMAHGLATSLSRVGMNERVVLLFLTGRFPELLQEATTALRTLREDSLEGREPESRIGHAIICEALRCFIVLASDMRWGDEGRSQQAIEKLKHLAAVARYSNVAHSAISAKLCALAAQEFSASSLWKHLASLSEGKSTSTQRALARFGRAAFLSGRSLAWPSQAVGINRLASGESFVLCTPTGSGKTTIAELALVEALFETSQAELSTDPTLVAPLALYLVPSRALAAEVEGRLGKNLDRVGEGRARVTGLYGGTDWGPTDAWLTSDFPTVLVCTYEKAEALLRFLGPLFMRRVKCVIIDEAHFVQFGGFAADLRNSESRALKLESLGARLLRALDGCEYRVIALSAVTAGLEGSISHWLTGDTSTPAHSDHRSTRQLVGRLECLRSRESRIQYDLLDRATLNFSDDKDSPYVPSPFPKHPKSPSFEAVSSVAALRPHLLWAAIHLVAAGSGGAKHSVLISVMSRVTKYAEDFLTLLEKDWAGEELPNFFDEPTDEGPRRLWDDCVATARDYFTEESLEYRLLMHGIAVHHGKMPALLARRLKHVIEEGIVRLVLATSTLSEGVNLPVEYILVPEVHRQPGNRVISKQEFMNLVGRAGRPGHGTEGRTLVLVPHGAPGLRLQGSDLRLVRGAKEAISSIANDAGAATTSAPTSPLARLLELLREDWSALARENSEAAFLTWLETTGATEVQAAKQITPAIECLDALDGILIAGLEELEEMRTDRTEMSPGETEDGLRRLWSHSFARVASSEAQLLERAFMRRGSAIPALYSDREERRRIYKTSLPPRSARDMLERAPAISAHLQSGGAYATWSSAKRYEFVARTVELISGIPRFAPAPKAGNSKVDWREVLRWWLDPSGSPAKPTPKQIGLWHEYTAKNFAYKVNWALGGVLALSFDQPRDGRAPVALSLEDWKDSGLPWIAFWMKELLTWGTLEPVAAFLLAKGGATTRPEAESAARSYHSAARNEEPPWDALDPREVRAWTSVAADPFLTVTQATSASTLLRVHLARPASEFAISRLRVFPHKTGDRVLLWTDAAGYEVATSESAELSDQWTEKLTDFVLDVEGGTVTMSHYL